nr:helix-turn-helix transcriptional regulator [Micromonospora sp. DSM 115978]
LDQILRDCGVHDSLVARAPVPNGCVALLMVLGPRLGAFTPVDREVIGLFTQHLGYLLRGYLPRPPDAALFATLSGRERDVVEKVAWGYSNQQIADSLHITLDTTKHHVTRAMHATGCANRTQLALLWHRCTGALLADLPLPTLAAEGR